MKEAKLCKTLSCSAKRYGTASICYRHWIEKQKLKREEKAKKKLLRKTSSKKFQKSELKKWHRKTWVLWSEWVRRSAADWRGFVECYTCRIQLPWKEAHASHRYHRKLDFDRRNIKNCCPKCNTYLHGNLGEYERRLIQENGLEWAEQLKLDANTHPGYRLEELKEIYNDLKEKISKLNLV